MKTFKILIITFSLITTITPKSRSEIFPTTLAPDIGDKFTIDLKTHFKHIKSGELTISDQMKPFAKVTNYFDKILSKSQIIAGQYITKDINIFHSLNSQQAILLVQNKILVKVNLEHQNYFNPEKLKIEKIYPFTTSGIHKKFKIKCLNSQAFGSLVFMSCIGKGNSDSDFAGKKVAFLGVLNPQNTFCRMIPIVELEEKISPRFKILVNKSPSAGPNIYYCAIVDGIGSVMAVQFDITNESEIHKKDEKFQKFVKENQDDKEIIWTTATFLPDMFTDTKFPVLALSGYQKFFEESGEFYWPVIYCIKSIPDTTKPDQDIPVTKFVLYRERIVNFKISQKDYKTAHFEVYKNPKYSSIGGYSFNIATREQMIEVGIEKKGSYFLFLKPVYKKITVTDSSDSLPLLYLQDEFWVLTYKQPQDLEKKKGLVVLDRKNLNGDGLKNIEFTVFKIFSGFGKDKIKKKYYIGLGKIPNVVEVYYLNPERKLEIEYKKASPDLKSVEDVKLTVHDLKGEIHKKDLKVIFSQEPELNIERTNYEVQGTEMVKVKIGMENSKVKFLNLEEGNNPQIKNSGYSLFFNKVNISFKKEDKFKDVQIDEFLPIDDLYFFLGVRKSFNEGDHIYHLIYSIKCSINLGNNEKNECSTTGNNKISAMSYYIKESFSVGEYIGIVVINLRTKNTRILFYTRSLRRIPKMTFDISENFLVTDYVINTYDIQNSIDIYAVLKQEGSSKTTVSFQEVYINPKKNTLIAQDPSYFYATGKTISKIYYEPKYPHIRLSFLFEQDPNISNRYFLIVDYKRVKGDNFQILNHMVYEPISAYPRAVLCPGKDYLMYFDKSQGTSVIFGEPKINVFNGTSLKYNLGKGSYIIGSRCFSHLGLFQMLVSTYEGEKYFFNLRAEFDFDMRERYHSMVKVPKDVLFFQSYHEMGKDYITTTLRKKSEKLGEERLILFTYYKGPEFRIDSSKLNFNKEGQFDYKLKFENFEKKGKIKNVILKKVKLPESKVTTKEGFPPKDFKIKPPQTVDIEKVMDAKGPVIDIQIKAPEGLIEGKNYTFHGRKPLVFSFFNNSNYEIKKMSVFKNWLTALIYNTKDASVSVHMIYKPTKLTKKGDESRFVFPEDESKLQDTVYNSIKMFRRESSEGKITNTFLLTSYQNHSQKGYFFDIHKMEKNGELEKLVKIVQISLEKQVLSEQFILTQISESELRVLIYEGANLVVYRIKKENSQWEKQGDSVVIELRQEINFWMMRKVEIKSSKLDSELKGMVVIYTNQGSSQLSSVWLGDNLKNEKIQFKHFKDYPIYSKKGISLGKTDLFDCDLKNNAMKVIKSEETELKCYSSFSGANDYFLSYKINFVEGFKNEIGGIFKNVNIDFSIVSTKGFESLAVQQSERFLAVKMKNLRSFGKVESFSQCPFIVSLYKVGEKFSYASVNCKEIGAVSEFDEPEFSILSDGEKDMLYISAKKGKKKEPKSGRILEENNEGGIKVFLVTKAKLGIINVFKLAGFKLSVETENGKIKCKNVIDSLLKLLKIPLKIQLKISSMIWFVIVLFLILFIGLCGIKRISNQGLLGILTGDDRLKKVHKEEVVVGESVVQPGNI